MMLPGKKHKWVARLIQHKDELNKLKKLQKKLKDKTIERLKNESNVTLTIPTLEKKAENTDLLKGIAQKIKNQQLIIEYLEKVEQVFRSMTWDIKNVIEIMKLEEL